MAHERQISTVDSPGPSPRSDKFVMKERLSGEDQRQRVRRYFNQDEGWRGNIYGVHQDRFARAVARRRDYVFSLLERYVTLTGSVVLDVGCGAGVYADELLARGCDTFGIDISPLMLEECRRRIQKGDEYFSTHFQVADVERIPFSGGVFDIVLCIGVLGYLLSDHQALQEMTRVLKPGGYLVVNVENMKSLSNLDFVLRKRVMSKFDSSAAALFQDNGYSMVSPWVLHHSPTNHRYRVFDCAKLKQKIISYGFRFVADMTFGFEMRLLRRIPFIPVSLLDSLEVRLERFIRRMKSRYVAYSGESYTGLFQYLGHVQDGTLP